MSPGQSWKDGPAERSFADVEKEFWKDLRERHEEGTWDRSQLRDLLQKMMPNLRERAESEKLSPLDYEVRLEETFLVIRDVANALNLNAKDPPFWLIWGNPNAADIVSQPKEWMDASPVDTAYLSQAVSRYLERPWMQSDTLEWYILRGYVFDAAARTSERVRSGKVFGFINWAFVFGGGNWGKMFFWRAGLDVAKPAARWIAPPASIALLYYYGHEEWALWLAWPVGAWLVISLLGLPGRVLRRRRIGRALETWRDRLDALAELYRTVSTPVFSPTHLLRRAEAAEEKGAVLEAPVFALLGLAVTRDPDRFIALPGEPWL